MRKFLDAVYLASGVIACGFLAGIAIVILAQILGRLTGILVPSADDIAGYSMGAATFFALAYSLRAGGHIRVSLVLQRLSPAASRWMELWALAVALPIAGYGAYWCIFMTWESYVLGDVSPGVLPIPLWIPQLAMSFGVTLFAIALLDDLVAVISRRAPSYQQGAVTLLEAEQLGDLDPAHRR